MVTPITGGGEIYGRLGLTFISATRKVRERSHMTSAAEGGGGFEMLTVADKGGGGRRGSKPC